MKSAKVRPSVFTNDSSEPEQAAFANPAKQTKDPECQVEQKEMSVALTDRFQEVLDELIGHVRPLLLRLQESGVIPQDKTLMNLNPDYTRFLLKEAQMSIKGGEENSNETQIYCMTICLHALVSSVDILMQSGLEAAIGKCKINLCSMRRSSLRTVMEKKYWKRNFHNRW